MQSRSAEHYKDILFAKFCIPYDSFSGKWLSKRTKISNFNSIVNRHMNNKNKPSSSSCADVMSGTLDEFRATHLPWFWEVFRNSPKWYLGPPVRIGGSSKRSKSNSGTPGPRSFASASDARSELNLEEPQELSRPPGRNKTKAANARARSKGKSTSITITNTEGGSSRSSKLDEKLARILSLNEQEIELEKSRKKVADIQFLKEPIQPHVSDEDQMIIEMEKQAIRAKYLNK